MSDSWGPREPQHLSITNSRSLPRLMSIESVMPSNRLILYHPLLLLPPILPSIRVFSNELALHIRWPKYWSFSFNISPSNEHPGLISFRMDWLISWWQPLLQSPLACHRSPFFLPADLLVSFHHSPCSLVSTADLCGVNLLHPVLSALIALLIESSSTGCQAQGAAPLRQTC